MTEFNPTKKDLLNLDERILSIKAERNKLINRKINIQNSLSRLRGEYESCEYMDKQFKTVKELRQHLKHELNTIELEMKTLSNEIVYKNKLRLEVDAHLRNTGEANSEQAIKIILQLNLLKVKYSDFAKDKTRVASLRIMASEFRDEIEKLILKIK